MSKLQGETVVDNIPIDAVLNKMAIQNANQTVKIASLEAYVEVLQGKIAELTQSKEEVEADE